MPSTIGIVSSSVLEYITIEYLQIGGGGGGAFSAGGGGGAGGYVEGTAQLPLKTLMGQIVGSGGQGGINSAGLYNGQTGENTVGFAIALGGGGGASSFVVSNGGDGGSGGGLGWQNSETPGASIQTSPIDGTGYGNSGGGVDVLLPYKGTGGGGAGAAGQTANAGGAGGAGRVSSITGTSVTYAGGGGAGAVFYNGGLGGSGGGGAGAGADRAAPVNGTANTGGGGGGGSNGAGEPGANGGSGIIILKYSNAFTITIGATLIGTTVSSGGFKVTTITSGAGNVYWT